MMDDDSQHISLIAEHSSGEYTISDTYNVEASAASLGYGFDWEKTIFINAIARRDINDTFANNNTYHIDASAWANKETRLHTSYGTAFSNPTFYQLYSGNGNKILSTEKSHSWDAGIEYNFKDADAYVDLTYFNATYTDMITYTDDAYTNLEHEASTYGLAFSGHLKMTEAFRVNTSYTYTQSDDGTGNELSYRPERSAAINANYQYTPKLSANIATNYVGKRLDENNDQLSSYLVTNIALIYKIHQHVTLSARLDNAFNEQYEEISGYDVDERTIYIGIKLH